MAANVGRWWKYAQAKLNDMVGSSNAELDELEAEQAARAEGKPWLSSDGSAPTLEETRARIEWEAEQQARRADAARSEAPDGPGAASAPGEAPPAPAPTADEADPEVVQAQLELDRQARESKARLEEIRKELGVDPPG